MRQFIPGILSGAVIAVTLACGGGEEAAPVDEAALQAEARADSVLEAEAQYDPANFDTIAWVDEAETWERGGVVYAYSCVKCHGSDGTGGGELAVKHELVMPDLTAADWEYANDVEAIRHRVYVGHESEMPAWGLYGLKYRDIDAVSHYINEVVRADG